MTGTAIPGASSAPAKARPFLALPAALRLYLVAVTALGAVALAPGIAQVQLDRALLVVGLLAAAMLSSTIKVALPLPRGSSTLSLSYVVNFAAILCVTPSEASVIAAAAGWSQCTFKVSRRNPAYQTLFSIGTLAMTAWASAWVFRLALPWTSGSEAGAALAAATAYFLLNTIMVAAAVALSTRDQLVRVWKQDFLWSSPTYYVGALIAVLAVALVRGGNIGWGLALAVPAYVSYRASKAHTDRVSREHQQVRDAANLQLRVIEALEFAIEAKDGSSPEHVQRMQIYAEGLAQAVGLSAEDVRAVRTAALLHDVGNLGVPEHILAKPGPLTKAEFERVKVHPRVGAEILRSVPFSTAVAPLILAHHERWDGRGYPLGIRGEDIPIGARILAVVDCFSSMISPRPYRPARAYAEALLTLRETAGSALDPALAEKLVTELPQLEAAFQADRNAAHATTPAGDTGSNASALDHIASAHREELVLREVAQAFGAAPRMADVVALISTHLVSLVPFTSSAVFLLDEASGLYLCGQVTGLHQDSIRAVSASRVEGLETQLPVVAARRGPGARPRLQSVVAAPLAPDGRAVGALVLYHTAAEVYTSDHRRLVADVASQAGPVVEKAILFEQAREQSLTDALTGLSNRRAVERQLADEVSRAGRCQASVSVLLFDMDGFKGINDVFGHQAGDRALQHVARCLRAGLREYDACARFDGDEFVVVLGGCDAEQGIRRLAALQDEVARQAFEPTAGHPVNLGISGGAATFPDDGATPAALIAAADRRMYRDKSRRLAAGAGGEDASLAVAVCKAGE